MALDGHNIAINGQESNPHTLNAWLKRNGGYDNDNDLEEAVVPKISPTRIVWTGPASGLKPEAVC